MDKSKVPRFYGPSCSCAFVAVLAIKDSNCLQNLNYCFFRLMTLWSNVFRTIASSD